MGRVVSIQIMRCVAVTLVVLLHCKPEVLVGGAGVDIFFVISGFIIYRVSAGKGPAEFLSDRVRRIYPLWYAASAPFALVLLSRRGIDFAPLATTITLWPVWGDYVTPYLTAGWTLSFEMLFYLAMALVLWKPRATGFVLLSFAASMAIALWTHAAVFRFIGNPIIIEFLAGIIIARLPALGYRVGGALVVLAIVGFALSPPTSSDIAWAERVLALETPWRTLQWGAPAALLVAGALQFERWTGGFVARFLAYVGDGSYAIYLAHPLTVLAFRDSLPWPVVFVAAMATGLIVHRYVEVPLIATFKRGSRRSALAHNATLT